MSESETDISQIISLNRYKCPFSGCDLEFRRKDRFDSHVYSHDHIKKFKCDVKNCENAYINNSHLQRHKRTAHSTSTEIIQCHHESCGAYFHSEAKLKIHIHNVHSKKKCKFVCDICNEEFRRKTKLRQHMFVHTGNYKYTCDKCGKGFLLLNSFRRHELSHRSRKCELCDATFDKWSSLLAHKRNEHATTQCSICNKEFHSNRCLKNHRMIHLNPDDRHIFACLFENCTKFFTRKTNMLAHYKSKHEHRKFVCTFEECKLELSTKQKLDHHIKVIHLGESMKMANKTSKTIKAKRKDKGVQKISTASKLFNIILPSEFERAIIAGKGQNIHINFDRIDSEIENNDSEQTSEAGAELNSTHLRCQSVVKC